MENRKFCLTITKTEIAKQIAQLLNMGGQLGLIQRYNSILSNGIVYYIEIELDLVVGVIGIEKKNSYVSEIKHLCVLPSHRKSGIGKKLLYKATQMAETPFIYSLIRDNNHVNINNTLKLGFKPIAKCQGITNELIVFARRRNGNNDNHC